MKTQIRTGAGPSTTYELREDAWHIVRDGQVRWCSVATEWDHYGEPGTGFATCVHYPEQDRAGSTVYFHEDDALRAVNLGSVWMVPERP